MTLSRRGGRLNSFIFLSNHVIYLILPIKKTKLQLFRQLTKKFSRDKLRYLLLCKDLRVLILILLEKVLEVATKD